MKLKQLLLTSLLFYPILVSAESYVYVTDEIEIPMRSTNAVENNPSNIISMLPSGSRLEILSTENSWTKVQFGSVTGWIISRYLRNNPPAQVQLKELRQKYNANILLTSQQKETEQRLEKTLKDLEKKNTELLIQTKKYQAERKHIEQVYSSSLELEHSNQKLKTQILQLKTEIQLLTNNNQFAQDTSARNWFIVGGLVLFFGFIIGLIFSKILNKRRF